MKEYACSKCKKKGISEEEIIHVQMTAEKGDVENPQMLNYYFCQQCANLFGKHVGTYFPDEPKEMEETQKKDGQGFVKGPISRKERAEIIRLYKNGASVEEIAEMKNRYLKGITRCINSYLRRTVGTSAYVDEQKIRARKEKEIKKNLSEKDSKKEDEDFQKLTKKLMDSNYRYISDINMIDKDKVMALFYAGWSVDRISFDMRTYPEIILQIINEKNKEERQ